eukprot:7384378-Prymnesium_polylepis.1
MPTSSFAAGTKRATPGGRPPAARDLLAFYVGGGLTATGLREGRAYLRMLFGNGSHPDVIVHQRLSAEKVAAGMARSKYCMIMGGYAPWTPRLVQSIFAGCVPVICSSLLPPFSRVLDWTRFSVRVGSLEELPQLRQILLRQDYEQLAAGVAVVRDALVYNRHVGLQADGVLSFLLLEMSLAIRDASRCSRGEQDGSTACSLAERAENRVGSLHGGDGTPSYEAPANRKQYLRLVKRMTLNAKGVVEGIVVVRTRQYPNVTRAWQCVPTVGHGHFLHEPN